MFSFPANQSQTTEYAFPVIKENVPMHSLGYNSNNKYPGFPPLMSDGRAVTASWQSDSVINADLIQKHGIRSNWEYRKYLTDNALDIMKYNFTASTNDSGYYKRPIDIPNIQSNIVHLNSNSRVPYLHSSLKDNTKPYGYTPSDLKDMYLSREQLDAKKISPSITQSDILKLQQRHISVDH